MISAAEKWLLERATMRSGFTPNAESVKELAVSLEARGLLRQSDNYPVWMITDAGVKALAQNTE